MSFESKAKSKKQLQEELANLKYQRGFYEDLKYKQQGQINSLEAQLEQIKQIANSWIKKAEDLSQKAENVPDWIKRASMIEVYSKCSKELLAALERPTLEKLVEGRVEA